MNKAIKICLIVFTVVYFVCFVLCIAGGIVPLALSSQITEELMKSDPNLSVEACQALIVSFAVSMFLSAFFLLAAACVCVITLAQLKKPMGFGKKITLGVFNIVIGSTPSGVLMVIQAALQKHRKEI